MGLLRRVFGRSPIAAPAVPANSSAEQAPAVDTREATGKAALNQILEGTREVVIQHSSTLVAKRRQKTYRDDYGRLIDDAWQTEIGYFRTNIVEPALYERYELELIAEAIVQRWAEATPEIRDAVGDVDVYFSIHLNAYIDVLVQSMASESDEPEPEVEAMTPLEYEHFCADALRASGWEVRVCGGTGDQGVDLVADRDGRRAVFQCKLYAKPVGNYAIQEVHTGRSFHDAHVAAVISPAGFTPSARAAAGQTGVHLLHHDQLSEFDGTP